MRTRRFCVYFRLFTPSNLARFLAGAAYSIGMIGNSGQTLGMMAMNIKVIRTDGRPPGFGVAAIRWIGAILSGCILGIGYLFILFTPEKQALHDMIASTYVVPA